MGTKSQQWETVYGNVGTYINNVNGWTLNVAFVLIGTTRSKRKGKRGETNETQKVEKSVKLCLARQIFVTNLQANKM